MDDMAGGAVTPPQCASSVPIPAGLAKAIKDDLKALSDRIDDPDQGSNAMPSLPTDCRDDQNTQIALRNPVVHFPRLMLMTRPYG